MRIDYFSRATIGCATLLAANTVQAAPPCVITPIESSPGEYIVELCETAKFSDLKNAIEFIIGCCFNNKRIGSMKSPSE